MKWFIRYLTSPFILVPLFTILLFFGGRFLYYHFEIGKGDIIKPSNEYAMNQLSKSEFPNIIAYRYSFPKDSPLYGKNRYYAFSFSLKQEMSFDVKEGTKVNRLVVEIIPIEKRKEEYYVLHGTYRGRTFAKPEELALKGMFKASKTSGSLEVRFETIEEMEQFNDQINNLMLWSPMVQFFKK